MPRPQHASEQDAREPLEEARQRPVVTGQSKDFLKTFAGLAGACGGRSMRSHFVLLSCLALLHPTFPAESAEIEPVKSADCRLKLEGIIATGDSAKLSAALDALPPENGREGDGVSICLN